jgi:hypothetical protein
MCVYVLTINDNFQSNWEKKRINNRSDMMVFFFSLAFFSHQSNKRKESENDDEMSVKHCDWQELRRAKTLEKRNEKKTRMIYSDKMHWFGK